MPAVTREMISAAHDVMLAKGDYASIAIAVLRAASAVLKARGEG